jgi:hypothetical protein
LEASSTQSGVESIDDAGITSAGNSENQNKQQERPSTIAAAEQGCCYFCLKICQFIIFEIGGETTFQSDAVQSAPVDADQGKAPTAEGSNTSLSPTESGLTSNSAITDSNQSATSSELASSTKSSVNGSVNKTSTTMKVRKYDLFSGH